MTLCMLDRPGQAMKSSKREIKSALAPSSAPGGGGAAPGSPGLFLKANLEYVRENYRKSIKLLHGCRKGGGAENQLLYLTNPLRHARIKTVGKSESCMVSGT